MIITGDEYRRSIITGDEYRPDLLVSTPDKHLYVVELTVGFESNLTMLTARKLNIRS